MRPAEVWGWYRYPFSSRSLMVLRIVAEDRAMANRFEIVRLPAGSAVSTYVSITASSTCRSRSVRDFGMSPNLLTTNNLDHRVGAGQVADESIEAEPPLGRANQPSCVHLRPAMLDPSGGRGRSRAVTGSPASVRNARYRRSSSRCSGVRISSHSTGERPAAMARAYAGHAAIFQRRAR